MTYVALLRSINVGGNNKIPMLELRLLFKGLGCNDVRTYINSGNVLFSDGRSSTELQSAIEASLHTTFGFTVKVLVIDKPSLDRIASALPDTWRTDATMKCDVLFLWVEKNSDQVLGELTTKPAIDSIKYVDGALLWSVPRNQVNESGLLKLAGTNFCKQMTIRNCNTVRKLAQLSDDAVTIV